MDAAALLRAAEAHGLAGSFEEGLALLGPALDERAPAALWVEHARLSVQLARFEPRRRDEALAAALRAQAAAERGGDEATLSRALVEVGRVQYQRAMHDGVGDYEEPMALFRRALAAAEASGDPRVLSDAAHHVGLAHERKQELAEAHAHHSRAYEIALAAGDAFTLAHALRHLGFLAFFLHGDVDGAIARLEESAELFEAAGCRWVAPLALQAVASGYFLGKKEPARAEPMYRRALGLAEDLGRELVVAEVLSSLGELLAATGRAEEARAAYARSRELAERVGHARLAREAAGKLAGLST